MMEHDPSSESNALPHSEKFSDQHPTALLVTSPEGERIGLARFSPSCRTYWPGHSIHPIHARHLAESRDWVPALINAVEGNYIEFTTDAATFRRWNHDPVALRRIAEIPELLSDAEVLWCERYYVLSIEVDHTGQLLSLGKGDVTPCTPRTEPAAEV